MVLLLPAGGYRCRRGVQGVHASAPGKRGYKKRGYMLMLSAGGAQENTGYTLLLPAGGYRDRGVLPPCSGRFTIRVRGVAFMLIPPTKACMYRVYG